LKQGFLVDTSSLGKFYGRHLDLVNRYGIAVSQVITDKPCHMATQKKELHTLV
jgi:hypothetical protein